MMAKDPQLRKPAAASGAAGRAKAAAALQEQQRAELAGQLTAVAAELGLLRAGSAAHNILPHTLAELGLADAFAPIEGPVGPVYVAFDGAGVTALRLAEDGVAFAEWYQARFGRQPRPATRPPWKLEKPLLAALLGGKPVTVPLHLTGLTAFERAVLDQAATIPRGEVRPYGWVAREIGRPGAVRAVGTALGNNPVPLLIPCHRVVRSDGAVGNYAFGEPVKRDVLAAEGLDPVWLDHLASAGERYHGSRTTKIYCFPTCRHARRIQERNRQPFRSEAAAREAGYRPCTVCRP